MEETNFEVLEDAALDEMHIDAQQQSTTLAPDAARAVPRHHPRSRVGIYGKAPRGKECFAPLGW